MNKAQRIISLLPMIEDLRDPAIDAIKDRNIRNEEGSIESVLINHNWKETIPGTFHLASGSRKPPVQRIKVRNNRWVHFDVTDNDVPLASGIDPESLDKYLSKM